MFILEIVNNNNLNIYLTYLHITCNQLVTIYIYYVILVFTNPFSNQLYKHLLFQIISNIYLS